MHDHWSDIEQRLRRMISRRLRPVVHRAVAPLDVTVWHVDTDDGEPVPSSVALPNGHDAASPSYDDPSYDGRVRYEPIDIGSPWGPPWSTSWFRVTGEVPESAAGWPIELAVDLGWADDSPGFQAEGLVYRPDGTVVKGLNPRNSWVPITPSATGGERIDLYIEAAANPHVLDVDPFQRTVLGDKVTAGDQPLYRLARADVAVLQRDVWELIADLEVLGGLARELDQGAPRRFEILRAIERSLDRLDAQDPAASAGDARKELADVLSRPAHASAHRISAVGHAHIDSAWLWPVRETVRKVRRTAANVVDLIDTYPEMVFAMSQAQQFAWIEEHEPELFARIGEQVAAGRFVPVGGMWVEPDLNMTGGEAMARQFLHGKRYFLDRFGVDPEEAWLPDTFGYSPALPQIMRLAGSRRFLTQKISWNSVNRFPHHTFWWEGIDGSRVFTHFPPIDTYNAELSGQQLAHAVRNFRDKGGATRSLAPFGWGDGGGGPTREMIARARRTADLEGSPRVTIEPPSDFFSAAESEYADAPVWTGELYLELHRGTYTSQAPTKQGNRRSEHLLREAELWCTAATIAGVADYPYEQLDRIWKLVLLNQFHDILPGSSIAWVHQQTAEEYATIAAELNDLIEVTTGALAGARDGGSDSVVTFNAAPHDREGAVALGGTLDAAAPADSVTNPVTYPVTGTAEGDGYVLDNGLLRVVVDGDGLLQSVLDYAAGGAAGGAADGAADVAADGAAVGAVGEGEGREVLAPAARGNLLQIHPDVPNNWDAWDVDVFYRNTAVDLVGHDGLDLVADDAAATVRIVRRFGQSRATQEITLASGARRVDFAIEVDWREREKFLKVGFDLDVHSQRAAFETQFGHHFRPTHENTSWDAARFEVCTHRWMHVGEPDYGVGVVNDATYGLDVRRHAKAEGGTSTAVRLSLLRAARFPDPDADQGVHRMRYAVIPGAEISDAIAAGYAINLPLRQVPGSESVAPVVRVDGDGVLVEAVKLAEDRSGDVVVRLYEAHGRRATVRVVPGFGYGAVGEVDLIERQLEPDAVAATGEDAPSSAAGAEPGGVPLRLRPFQIVTLRFHRPTPQR